jgi:hypothetical protein
MRAAENWIQLGVLVLVAVFLVPAAARSQQNPKGLRGSSANVVVAPCDPEAVGDCDDGGGDGGGGGGGTGGGTSGCIPDGGVDDTLYATNCCSGMAVSGSTYCSNPADWGTTWASCSQICGTVPVNGCIPSGGIDDTLNSTSCCSGSAVPGSTWCLNPADYGTTWRTCVQTCQ